MTYVNDEARFAAEETTCAPVKPLPDIELMTEHEYTQWLAKYYGSSRASNLWTGHYKEPCETR